LRFPGRNTNAIGLKTIIINKLSYEETGGQYIAIAVLSNVAYVIDKHLNSNNTFASLQINM
jgi:hypothetical protein